MNPARSLAPAVVAGQIHHLWIYLTAPLLGTAACAPWHGWLMDDSRSAAASDGTQRVAVIDS